jgi:hypothetical protein
LRPEERSLRFVIVLVDIQKPPVGDCAYLLVLTFD